MARRPPFSLRFAALGALFACASACALDSSDLAAFQHTASGPEKLRAILQSHDQKGALRAEAALRLLDLPRSDIDGRALLFSELNRLDALSKRAILPAFKDGLSLRMQTRVDTAPSASAIRAKDAGTKLLPLLDSEERALLGSELIRFIAEDVPQRADAGELSLEEIADKVGKDSAKALVRQLQESMDAATLARLAPIIDKHADPGQRAQAAARWVQLEQSYRARHGSDAAALSQQILPSLGRFADQAAARARLIAIAADADVALSERRQALELLSQRCTEDELGALLGLAQSEAAPQELRVLALSRAGEIGSRKALPVLLVLLTDRKHHALRSRAGELSLSLGGTEGALGFFRNLPTGWGMTYDKQEIDAYSEQLAKLPPDTGLLLLLGEKLHSSFWWNRVMALRYFASRGTAEDVWRIRLHVHDELPIFAGGYPRGHTVGLEAETALAQAIERLHANHPARLHAATAQLGEASQ